MKLLLLFLVVFVIVHNVHPMSEKQMKAAAKLIKNACVAKTKVSDAQVDDMHKGKWDEDPNCKCYMNCVVNMLKVGKKNGEFDLELGLKQIPSLPESRQGPTEISMNKCSETIVYNDDKCNNSWMFGKCLYMDNPENYFLP